MEMRQKAHRIGLGIKLGMMLIVCILVIALGFLRITYGIYSRKVNDIYLTKAERAASHMANYHLPAQYTGYLRKMIDTEEFRRVRARAEAENDEQIIRNWMLQQPSVDLAEGRLKPDPSGMTGEEKVRYTLYGDYDTLVNWELAYVSEIFDVDVYIQYVADGVTYNLADPDMSLMDIGMPEEPIEALAQYTGNDRIPPTIYEFRNNWLCTACEPIQEEWDGIGHTPVAQACVDIPMNDVIRERHWFLVKSAAFIIVFTLAALAVILLLTRKLTTKPLGQLAEGAAYFEMRDEGFSKDDVIELPIRTNDEIGDLYHEIKLMQERIVDNADRMSRATAERERVSTELAMAAAIQRSALPGKFPAFPDRREFDLYASMDPAKEVGGDFYDFFLVDDDHLALVIADVSDKGVPAALFMMSARNILKFRARMGGTPSEILRSVNEQLCRDNPMMMFVTVWLGILQISTGRVTCANAGHEYPMLRQPCGAFQMLKDEHGAVMGVRKKTGYRDYTIDLEPGSKLFVYTDGLAEANNEQEELFGTDRILQALNADPGGTPRELLGNVHAVVNAFAGEARQYDDLTMLCLEYRGRKI